MVARTALSYTVSGVTSSDVSGGFLMGTAIVGADGQAQIVIPLALDKLTEGTETLAVSVQGQASSVQILDVSTTLTPSYAITAGKAEAHGLW